MEVACLEAGEEGSPQDKRSGLQVLTEIILLLHVVSTCPEEPSKGGCVRDLLFVGVCSSI